MLSAPLVACSDRMLIAQAIAEEPPKPTFITAVRERRQRLLATLCPGTELKR